jgi:NAD(P)-dependent dehydrogenase (short-subunit alcohol dehydrogenase family)
MTESLDGRVAVVTGASRGAGAAIARALGEAGATVYVTGRSTREGPRTEDLPGTIEDSAEAVTTAGGRGIPARVDHTIDSEVEALFARVRDESGRLDLLVNNAWGGYERYGEASFVAPFWEQPLWRWDMMYTAGVRAHLVAGRFAAPLMIERRQGIIVSTIAWAFDEYLGNAIYDSAKAAIIRLSFGMAKELKPYGVASVAVAPGWMRTERIMAAHAQKPFDLGATESPGYLGRAIVALAQDSNVMERSGKLVTVGELARELGFTDLDGSQPPPFRFGHA